MSMSLRGDGREYELANMAVREDEEDDERSLEEDQEAFPEDLMSSERESEDLEERWRERVAELIREREAGVWSAASIMNTIACMGIEQGKKAEQSRDHFANERTFLTIVRHVYTVVLLVFMYNRIFPTAPHLYATCFLVILGCLFFLVYGYIRYFVIMFDINGLIRGRLFFYFDLICALVVFAYLLSIALFVG